MRTGDWFFDKEWGFLVLLTDDGKSLTFDRMRENNAFGHGWGWAGWRVSCEKPVFEARLKSGDVFPTHNRALIKHFPLDPEGLARSRRVYGDAVVNALLEVYEGRHPGYDVPMPHPNSNPANGPLFP